MGEHGGLASAPLTFGCALQFQDCRQGTLAALEVDDNWEVLNVILERGFAFWKTHVKIAFSAAASWSYDRLLLNCASSEAFERKIPPIAAPARPLLRGTRVALSGVNLIGLLVEPSRRLSTGVIFQRGADKLAAPIASVTHDGNALHVSEHELSPYVTDEQLMETARRALAAVPRLTGDERSTLDFSAAGGIVTIAGNVRTQQMTDLIEASLTSPLPTAARVNLRVVDDISLELAIGRALDSAGLQHHAEVYPRSLLGEVTLFGRADSAAQVDEIARAVSHVSGVRSVTSRMVIDAKRTALSASRSR
jgi:osmotically-inducible protein OsmY